MPEGLKPTSMGRALDKTYSPTTDVIFDGGLSHDNDSQTKRYLQRWKWDFDYDIDFCEFTTDEESYSPLVSHRYTTPGTYVVGVKYIDDDGVEGDVYLFTVVVSSIKRYYYVKDHLGSIRQTIDDNGVVVEKQDYSSFGAILPGRSMNTASPNEKYKFTEKERDKESGLDYFGARYYDSEVGRWLSIDPLADKYPGWSPYNYCANNPLRFIDPDGNSISTYTDQDGNVTEITNDGKTDIYKQNDKGNVTHNGQNYELAGHSVDLLSFADQNNPYNSDGTINIGKDARINFGSNAAGDAINNSLAQISPNLMGFAHYALNAGNGEPYDIKRQLGVYIGSQISPGLYASGRDAGNILAGSAAYKSGLDFTTAMTGYGSLQMSGNSKALGLANFMYFMSKPFGSASIPNYGEAPVSHRMQAYGYLIHGK